MMHKKTLIPALATALIAGVFTPSIATADEIPRTTNGYTVIPESETKVWTVDGQEFKTRTGNATEYLQDIAQWFNKNIESVSAYNLDDPTVEDGVDDWSWVPPRPIRGGEKISNHASGTAIDLNASLHPRSAKTLTDAQRQLIREKMKDYDGKVIWGGDWTGDTIDEMHFELKGTSK